jgi:phenylalanyl-tRNA synthetase beta chain
MPVVALELSRLSRIAGADSKRILDRLPYLGLDIESHEGDVVRVEYSPNRPDFGTEYGIAKAMRGLLGIEVGLKRYRVLRSGLTVNVDPRLSKLRPFISCATVRGLSLDEEGIRQLISLQEDLHNGLGRRRRKVAIGLHDLGSITGPLRYEASEPSSKFTPLGGSKQLSLREILSETETGRTFGQALEGARLLPLLTDSAGVVLSFPPIVNDDRTKVTTKTKGILVDVTSTDLPSGDEVLAILATTLADMGGRIGTVGIRYQRERRVTPDLSPTKVGLDAELIGRVTGLQLSKNDLVRCLKRSRLDVSGKSVLIPRYRIDILHPVDAAEEVALGYGIDRIKGEYPPSTSPGSFNRFDDFLDKVADVVSGSGMIELMNFELVDEQTLYGRFGLRPRRFSWRSLAAPSTPRSETR